MRPTFPPLAAALAIVAAFLALGAAATPPKTLSYQGFLTSASDTPIDAPVQMTFKIYNVPTGGVALWTETQPSVTVAKGEFNTVFGFITPLTLPFDAPYYLGVTVGSDPEMVPRQPLAASAYAFRAMSLDGGATVPGAIVTGAISTATIPGAQVTGDLSGASNIDLANSTAAVGNIVKNGTVFLHDFGSGNVFLGAPSGNFTMTGIDNTGIGRSTLVANTTGQFNTAVGLQALPNNTTGSKNTAIGVNALGLNTTGSLNTALGEFSLFSNTTGGGNTAIGEGALNANTTGNNNTAVGNAALLLTTTGTGSTAVGQSALLSNTSGSFNVAVGAGALGNNTVGSSNTALGSSTMILNTTAGKNTALGTGALFIQSFSNGGVGWDSMNTAVGYNALTNNQPSTNTNGVNNTAVGALALSSNTTGFDNTAVGQGALPANTTGIFNTAVGMQTLMHNTTGQLNTALGINALNGNTTGLQNIAIGNMALFASQTASFNQAMGNGTLQSTTTGQHNIAIGGNALFNTTTANSNLAIGEAALFQNVSGSDNTAIGHGALNSVTGSNNIALGEVAAANVTSGSFNIEIGNPGLAGDSSVIRIGTSGTQSTAFMAGVRGVTTAGGAIAVLVDTSGQLGTVSSSRTVKEDIEDMGGASALLMKLRPVTFHYKQRPGWPLQYGLIAEEVAEVAPELTARSAEGVIETVYYQALPPMLLNEYQKQQRVIEAQRVELDAVKRELALVKSKLGLD